LAARNDAQRSIVDQAVKLQWTHAAISGDALLEFGERFQFGPAPSPPEVL
jgi:hypothetical protein